MDVSKDDLTLLVERFGRDWPVTIIAIAEDGTMASAVATLGEISARCEEEVSPAPACPLGNQECRGAACYKFDDCEVHHG